MEPKYTCVLDMSHLPKEGIHTSLCVNKAYINELNLLGGVLSMALKLSLPLSISTYFERIALYAKHVKSK